jgi:hypothetical protein
LRLSDRCGGDHYVLIIIQREKVHLGGGRGWEGEMKGREGREWKGGVEEMKGRGVGKGHKEYHSI